MTFSFIKMPGATSVNNEPQPLEEKLSGDQHKLDHDKDGDIDGKDFAMLRMKKKSKKMDSPTKDEPEGENGDTAEMNPKMKDKEKKMEKTTKEGMSNAMFVARKQAQANQKRIDKGMKPYTPLHPDHKNLIKPIKKKMGESKIRTALKSVVENRGEHYRSATPPETMDDKLKGGGAKKMKADFMKGAKMNDTVAKAPEDAKAAGSRGPSAKPRNSGDNTRSGDSKVVQGGTPMKDPASPKQRLESIINAYKGMYTSIDDQQKSLNEDMHHIMNHVKNHNFDMKYIYRHEKHGDMVDNLRSHHIKVSMKHRECAEKLATDPHHGPGHPLHMAHHEAADAHEKAHEAHKHIMGETRRGQNSTSNDDKNFHAAMSASHDAAGKSSETFHVQRETSG